MPETPPILFFEITDRCNHACFYCCKSFRGAPGLTMTEDQLDCLLALPRSGLVISGGEPSLVKDRVAYVLERTDGPVAINTNLTGWTPDELAALPARARLNIAVPSIERDCFEAITGAGTFGRLLANLEAAPRDSVIGIAVHGKNRAGLSRQVAWLAVRGFHRFRLQPVYGAAAARENVAASLAAIERVFAENRQLDIRLMAPCPSAAVPASHACNAGAGRLVILSTGDIVPCACRKMDVLGNLFADDFDYDAARAAGAAFHRSFPEEQRPLCKGYQEAAC